MITLHESNITSFPLDNGIGVLSDAIKAYTEEELNGLFEFYMEYDSEGHLVEELKEERIIKAKAQDKLGYQLFRIYSVTKSHENDNLIVNAQHITYDLANNFVEKMEANRLTKKQVMEKIGSSTVLAHPFNITSPNTTTVSSTSLYRTNPLQMIAGMDGSILQIWGGQIERDNFHLILHDRRGSDDGVKVAYKKNLTGLQATFDISGLVTRIFPFVFIEGNDNEPSRLITVNGKYIDSPHINDYEKVYIQPIDYSNDDRIDTQDKTDSEIRQQLTNVAKDYFKETGNDKIKVEMDVAFAHLWETEEYKDVKVLELVGMGDTVTINHSRLKVNATAIVNYIRYDCIAHVNEEVRLGSVKARLTDNVNKIDNVIKHVERAEQDANQAIRTANGKNTIFYGPDEPTDAQKDDLWFKVVDGEYTRTYRHDGIQWQLVLSVDVRDAIDEAQQAKDDAQDAVDRANQATQTANTAIGQAQAGFDLAQDNATQISSLGLQIGNVEDGLTTISSTVQGLQTTVSDIDGNVSNLTQLSNAMQARLSDAEGNINTLTLTSQSMQSTISSLPVWKHVLPRASQANPIELTYPDGRSLRDNVAYEIYLSAYSGTGYNNYSIYTYENGILSLRDRSGTPVDARLFLDNGKVMVETHYHNESQSYPYTATVTEYEGRGARSVFTQLSDAINLRVAKGDVINQINISDESILIAGRRIHITGQTTIDNGVIKSAHIQSLDAGKITTGVLDAGQVTLINLVGLDIYGSRFRSSTGSDFMEIVGGNIRLQNSNGRYVNINPTGFYGYNANNSVRFQADASLVTSAAFGTSNLNVYLAAGDTGSLGEIRTVRYDTIPGTGDPSDYSYVNLRTRAIKSPPNRNAYIGTDGELRIMSEGLASVGVYRNVRATGYYGNFIEVNTGSILYLRSNNRIRLTKEGSTTNYTDLQCYDVQARSIRFNEAVSGSHFYVGVSTGELRVTTNSLADGSYRPVRASSFNESSSRDYKTNIEEYTDSALEIIQSLTVVSYNLKDDLANGIIDQKIGFISEDSPAIATIDGKAIQTYQLSAYNTKAIQELDMKFTDLEDRVNWLEIENQYLRQKIEQLEDMVA